MLMSFQTISSINYGQANTIDDMIYKYKLILMHLSNNNDAILKTECRHQSWSVIKVPRVSAIFVK
jgi:hypothetical protein